MSPYIAVPVVYYPYPFDNVMGNLYRYSKALFVIDRGHCIDLDTLLKSRLELSILLYIPFDVD